MRIWIDVENPPQVQYLTPLVAAFEESGASVILTARDYGSTLDLLAARDLEFTGVGASYGRSKVQKVTGLIGRAQRLIHVVRPGPKLGAAVHAGRAPAIVARRLGVPSFGFRDYEFVDLRVDRFTQSYVTYPSVIGAEAFIRRGIRPERLLPFKGLKEDLSFAGVDINATPPYPLATPDELLRVLVRPAAEESHYYRSESGSMIEALLRHLATEQGVVVVFSPRYPHQIEYLRDLPWRNTPLVIGESVPFLPLLKAIDIVITSGGTMAREAAYLGKPAYSVFQGETGGVDRELVSLGRLELLKSPADFECIRLERVESKPVLRSNPNLLAQIVEDVIARALPGS